MKILDIITESAATGTREDAIIANWLKNNPQLQVVERVDPKVAAHAEGWLAKNKRVNAEIMAGFRQRYGLAFGFLTAIGIIIPLVDCVSRLRALNEQAKEKDANGNFVHDMEWVHRQENAIVGVFLASQLATVVVASIRAGSFVTGLSALLNGAAMRTPGGARAKILAMIATQAGLAALSLWISSDEGKAWCTTGLVVPLLIGGLGAIGNEAMEIIRNGIKKHTGKDIGIVTPDINQRKDAEAGARTGPTDDEIKKAQDAAELRTRPGQVIR
jgi:hypothetical protein